MIKIKDLSRLRQGKREKEINAPEGINFETNKFCYNVQETPDGILIIKTSLNYAQTIQIEPEKPNQILIR